MNDAAVLRALLDWLTDNGASSYQRDQYAGRWLCLRKGDSCLCPRCYFDDAAQGLEQPLTVMFLEQRPYLFCSRCKINLSVVSIEATDSMLLPHSQD